MVRLFLYSPLFELSVTFFLRLSLLILCILQVQGEVQPRVSGEEEAEDDRPGKDERQELRSRA